MMKCDHKQLHQSTTQSQDCISDEHTCILTEVVGYVKYYEIRSCIFIVHQVHTICSHSNR